MNQRLGKHPKKHDSRTLKMARYLTTLPSPPPAVDRSNRLPADIGMMGNDKYGNCTIAAAGHMVQSWTTYAERGMQTIPDADIISAYLKISPYDQGAYMLDALNYWRKTGVGPDKIEAFVETGAADVTQAKLAVHHFGGLYIGLALPDVNTFGPWTTPTGPPNPYNGHAVVILSYDESKRMFKVATWGKIIDMSEAWFQRYSDESYAALNDISLIITSGMSPSGFDWAQLQNDLLHLGDPVVGPNPSPPTPPAPAPTPGHNCMVKNMIMKLRATL